MQHSDLIDTLKKGWLSALLIFPEKQVLTGLLKKWVFINFIDFGQKPDFVDFAKKCWFWVFIDFREKWVFIDFVENIESIDPLRNPSFWEVILALDLWRFYLGTFVLRKGSWSGPGEIPRKGPKITIPDSNITTPHIDRFEPPVWLFDWRTELFSAQNDTDKKRGKKRVFLGCF